MKKQEVLTKEFLTSYLDKSLKTMRSGMTKDIKEHVTKEIADLAGMTQRQFIETNEKIDRIQRDLSGHIVAHSNRIRTVERAVGI